ncbi:hypothetical protein MA16_Dca028405 [Dendrobium catenatum]|uniref:Uncharacterized protein n=1 Tax=Dendrobium catenatum TaxID=906689 RepID=A0A2I0V9X4_9ASPA|nr:hypothetical protein MA16_Dca028405 [Dendrobium catenatum]
MVPNEDNCNEIVDAICPAAVNPRDDFVHPEEETVPLNIGLTKDCASKNRKDVNDNLVLIIV